MVPTYNHTIVQDPMHIPMIITATALPHTAMDTGIITPTTLEDHILLGGIHHHGMILITPTATLYIMTTSKLH